MECVLHLIFVVLLIQPIYTITSTNRSCSDIITYAENSPGKYSARLIIIKRTPPKIINPIIKITFNSSVNSLEIKSPKIFYIIKEKGSTFNLKNITNLTFINPLALQFFVKFNKLFNTTQPRIINIMLNNEIICLEKITESKIWRTTTESNFSPFSPSQFFQWLNVKSNLTEKLLKEKNQSISNDECGISSIEFVVSTKRQNTKRGEFPWHSAIYYKKKTGYFFECGGTLITKNSLVTAAHCVTYTETNEILDQKNFLIYLGLFNLRKELGGEQIKKISRIIVHPEYDFKRAFYSDLAIMKFEKNLETTSIFVRPICLWKSNTAIEKLENQMGIVPGWALNGELSVNLTSVKMPLISRAACITMKPDMYSKMLLGKSFCAGKTNESSVCNGDSGGGMIFRINGKWYLRGIVSISIRRRDATICDFNFYPVFTDAAKFSNWIMENSS